MADYSQMTLDELTVEIAAIAAEKQKRDQDKRLKDQAWNLVLDAKNAGYSKAQVANVLTSIVNQAFQ